MADFQPANPNFEAVVRESFGRQTAMTTIGAQMTKVVPGAVVIEIPYRADLTQQNGFMHGGIITAIADSACGYAAYTLMPEDTDVLAVEFKIKDIRQVELAEILRCRRLDRGLPVEVVALRIDAEVQVVVADVVAAVPEIREVRIPRAARPRRGRHGRRAARLRRRPGRRRLLRIAARGDQRNGEQEGENAPYASLFTALTTARSDAVRMLSWTPTPQHTTPSGPCTST